MYVYIYIYTLMYIATIEGSPSLTRQEARPFSEAVGRRARPSQFFGLEAFNSTNRKGVLDNKTIGH
jgi:hypothetical protein